MVKCTRKYKKSKTVKRKYSRKYTKKSGGNKHFSEQDIDYLRQVGFSQKDIEYLHRRKRNGANIPIAFIRHFINIGYISQKIIDDMEEGEETDNELDGGKRKH
jgi:hypothetical protein